MSPADRYLRLLFLLGARVLAPLFSGLPGYRGLKRTGTEAVAGIKEPVEIRRDHLGIPSVHAALAEDLFFGFGYAIAQDRLWQMDLYRRVAEGSLAEVLGDRSLSVKPGAALEPESVVQLDCLHRALGLGRAARASLGIISAEARSVLEQYAAGANAAIATMQDGRSLPVEFYLLGYEPEPWRPENSLAVGRLIAWMLCLAAKAELVLGAVASRDDLSPLLPVHPAEAPVIVPGFTVTGGGGGGSNSWVVGPRRTQSGYPLLCNDIHLPMGLPCIFYQVNLQGGEYHVSGATIPGTPVVIAGTNPDCAWGVTSAMPDDADFYRETLHPSDPNLCALDGTWRRLNVEEEEIAVRDSHTRRVAIRYIPRGGVNCPLLSDILPSEVSFSIRWTGMEPSRELDALLKICRARGLDGFRDALRDFAVPAQNFVYADRKGSFGYFCAGRYPRRRKGDGSFPLDGASAASDWQGEVPFDELPFLINPTSGVIVTANHRIVDETYPHELTYLWEPPYRARRILHLLDRDGLDITDMTAIQLDILSLQARELVKHVVSPVAEQLGGVSRRAARRLIDWDCRMEVDSCEAALYHVFYERLRSLVFADRLNQVAPDLYRGYFSLLHLPVLPVDRILERGDPLWMPEGKAAVVRLALEQAVAFLEKRLGAEEEWGWGNLHAFTLRHPLGDGPASRFLNAILRLNRGPFPHPGDGMTVNVAAYRFSHPFDPVIAPCYRQIVDLGNPSAGLWVIPGGSSGDPFSPHYSDQLLDWRHGKYHRLLPISQTSQIALKLVPINRQHLHLSW